MGGHVSSELKERAGNKEFCKLLNLSCLDCDMILKKKAAAGLREIYTSRDASTAGVVGQNNCYGTVTGRGE
jgi:hypothetical protein